MSTAGDARPVLWEGELVCSCGLRERAEVLGRRGHRYDELELPPDAELSAAERAALETFVHESYTAEGRAVLDLAPCPRCGRRPGLARELRRVALWLAVLTAMAAATAALLWGFGDRVPAMGVGVAWCVAVAARAVTFALALVEAKDRVRLGAPGAA